MSETSGAAPEGDPTRAALKASADGHAAPAPHASTGHGSGAGHADQGDGAPLGPVDAQAWGAGILGVGTGLLVALVLYLVSYH